MQLLRTATWLLLATTARAYVVSQASAASTSDNLAAPIPGYGVYTPSWEVEVRPGESVVLNGTIGQIRRELVKLNPDWESFASTQQQHALGRRGAFPAKLDYKCGGHEKGSKYYGKVLKDTASELFWVPGQPKNSAGPKTCGRVGCKWNTGTWWCNHDTKPKTLDGFTSIADGVKRLWVDKLCWDDKAGEVFHPDNWSVIVAGAPGLEYMKYQALLVLALADALAHAADAPAHATNVPAHAAHGRRANTRSATKGCGNWGRETAPKMACMVKIFDTDFRGYWESICEPQDSCKTGECTIDFTHDKNHPKTTCY
ncbi:putative AC transposase [Purpureocillium lavendulum]|uniref:AC transposase n=1 Tax=Purpureocillium lavendulum TaxID=1247861 RepID=A0AB34FEW5_9HYPO|nr:putative AC transposase [Purpureocillium lavendulum]